MATAPKPEDGEGSGITGEYKRPDMAAAIKIYKDEIAPINELISTKKGDLSDPHKRIKNDCNCPRKVLDFLMQLADMEDAKRDHWLLAIREGMRELGMFMPSDLATMADGDAGADVIPTGERSKPTLVAVAADKGDGFEEASEEELAQQEGRPEPQPGTGAAAMKAMNEKAAEEAAKSETVQ